MAHLSEILTVPGKRAAVVADACALLDREVAGVKGVSGIAVRSGYKLLKGVRPGIVPTAVDTLLPPFAEQLDPFYQEHLATGEDLSEILVAQRSSMDDALRSITDDRAERTSHGSITKAYRQLRGTAKKHVENAAPGIGQLIAKHAA
jgi:hypothetical protein